MADKVFITATGFVQFDPIVRDANGKQVTDVLIKLPGGDQTLLKITVWPEVELEAPLAKGDFIAVDGDYSSSTYQDKNGQQRTSLQINAYMLAVLGKAVPRKAREVVGGNANQASPDTKVPF